MKSVGGAGDFEQDERGVRRGGAVSPGIKEPGPPLAVRFAQSVTGTWSGRVARGEIVTLHRTAAVRALAPANERSCTRKYLG